MARGGSPRLVSIETAVSFRSSLWKPTCARSTRPFASTRKSAGTLGGSNAADALKSRSSRMGKVTS
jgi:hypothetical protein